MTSSATTTPDRVLVYGCSGYAGRALVKACRDAGLAVIAAGRNPARTARCARELQVDHRVCDLVRVRNTAPFAALLRDVRFCINAAGPFEFTARKLASACIKAGVHYLDLSGELEAIRAVAALDEAAQAQGTLLLPAAGYAVAPTDCAIYALLEQDNDICDIDIYLTRFSVYSRGSARTMMNMVRSKVAVIEQSKAAEIDVGTLVRSHDFGAGDVSCTAINWPDIATASQTVRAAGGTLRNLAVFLEADFVEQTLYNWSSGAARWLNQPLIRATVDAAQTTLLPDGPSAETLARLKRTISIVGRTPNGVARRWDMVTRDPYTLTTEIALWVITQLQQTAEPPTGFRTPGELYGTQLLGEFAGSLVPSNGVRQRS